MPDTLRGIVRKMMRETDVPIAVIARKAGVPYGALYYFAHNENDSDMQSRHLENLYEYFTGEPLIESEGDEGQG